MKQIYAEAFSNLALLRIPINRELVSLDWFSALLDNQRENLIKINFVLSFSLKKIRFLRLLPVMPKEINEICFCQF